MSSPIYLRVDLGGDGVRKNSLISGMPASVDQLASEIKTAFGLKTQILEINMLISCQPVKYKTGIH